MADSTVRIGLVLPDVMGTYGDGGNPVVLRQRLRLRELTPRSSRSRCRTGAVVVDLYTLAGPRITRSGWRPSI